MAITDAYVSTVEYRAETGALDAANELVLQRQLLAVSRYLDRETGQFFTRDAEPVARIFAGDGTSRLKLTSDGAPGIVSATGLVLKVDEDDDDDFAGETAIDNTTIHLLPFNAAAGPEPEPYRWLELTSRSAVTSFPAGKLVQVTAAYGWPDIPEAVKSLTMKLTGIWRDEMPEATGRVNELDQLVNQSPLAMSLVKRFKLAYKRYLVG